MTPDAGEDPYAILHIGGGRAVVHYVRRIGHPQDIVWTAMSDAEHLAMWFPTTIDGERAAGTPLTFRFTDVDIPPMTGVMRAVDPPSTMEFTWGDDVVRFELTADGAGATVLTFTVTMAEMGKAARDAAGWHICLDDLAAHLAGERRAEDPGDRWRAVNGVYVARFGPEASTIDPPQAWEDRHGPA